MTIKCELPYSADIRAKHCEPDDEIDFGERYCPICGFNNIDCGKDGYKTDCEIELEKKLEIAVKALKCYAFADFEAEEIEHDELSPNYGVPVIKKFPYAINPKLAQQALKEIKG